jgi:hypothetical protein
MEMFGRTESQLSRIVTHMLNDLYDKFHHLLEFDERRLTAPKLEELAQTVAARGAPLDRCFGFIDGTLREVCRPSLGQRQLFSGHKRTHGLKFQSVVTPDGIIIHMSGPWAGRHHDAHMLEKSGLAALLERHCSDDGGPYLIYSDPAYPVRAHIRGPHRGTQLTVEQEPFLVELQLPLLQLSVFASVDQVCLDFAHKNCRKEHNLWRAWGAPYGLCRLRCLSLLDPRVHLWTRKKHPQEE